MTDDFNTAAQLKTKRDQRTLPHLEQYAPVWIVDEKMLLEDEAIQFNVLFLHPTAGDNYAPSWVNRRYRYDAFNNALYHKGQTRVSEEDAIAMTNEKTPYFAVLVEDMPNAYGG
jgi:hypothetical protein